MAKRALYDLTLKLSANSAELTKGINEANEKINSFQKQYSKSIGAIKTNILAFAAAAGGAFKTFEKVLNSTQFTADALQVKIAGIKEVANTVAQNLASLDFSVSLKDAKKAAEELTKVLDDLADRKRSVDIISAKNYSEVVKLRGQLRDTTISEEKRLEVSKRIQEIGQEELDLKKQIAEEALGGMKENFQIKYRIDLESAKLIQSYVEDYARFDRSQQDALNNAMAAQQKLDTYLTNNSENIEKGLYRTKTMEKYQLAVAEATKLVTPELQKYIELWRPINDLSDEQKDRIKAIVVEWYNANSAIQTYLNTAEKVENKLGGAVAAFRDRKSAIPVKAIGSGNINAPTSFSDVDDKWYPNVKSIWDKAGLRNAPTMPIIETTNELEKQINMVDNLTGSFVNLFSSITGGFDSMVDTFKSMLTKMAAEMAAKAAVFGVLKLLFPGTFIGLDLFKTGSFFNFIKPFASGTNYAPGGLSLVGEHGPELVNIPRGSQVYSNRQTQNMLFPTEQLVTRLSGKDIEIILRRS